MLHYFLNKGYIVLGVLIILTTVLMVLYRAFVTIDAWTMMLIFVVGAWLGSGVCLVGLLGWWYVWRKKRRER